MINNEFMALNRGETETYSLISSIISLFSLLGSSFIISVYHYFPSLQTFGFKLVVYLSLADLCFSFAKIMSFFSPNTPICEIQAFIINGAQLSSVLWTVIISFTLKKTLIYQIHDINKEENKYLIFGFVFPILYSLFPLVLGMYSYTGCWCWITIDPTNPVWGNLLRIFEFEAVLWFALGFNFYWYIRCIVFLRNVYKKEVSRSLLIRLFSYPMVLVVCWSWTTINRVYNIFGENSTTLNVLQIVFVSFEGLINAIIYGLNKNVRTCLRERFFGSKEKEIDQPDLLNNLTEEIEMSEALNEDKDYKFLD